MNWADNSLLLIAGQIMASPGIFAGRIMVIIGPRADNDHYYMGGPILLSKRWAASFTVSGRHTGNYAALGPS